MRVAIIAHARYPIAEPFAGGLESFTWHLARGLKERGVAVTVFAGPGSDPDLEVEELRVDPVVLSPAARADVAMPAAGVVQETFAYLGCMQQLAARDDVDVIHNNSLHYLPIALSELSPAPFVTNLHTPPTPWLEPALRSLGERANTIAVSHAVARQWHDVVQPRVIHNGIDMRQWRAGEGGPDLVWMGRIVREKAPHLAALVARMTGRRLRIAGPLSDVGYFTEELAPLLGDDVSYVGHLRPRELVDLVGSSSACLVTPQWEEPFGLVAPEAMACGTPVVALALGGLREVVREPGGVIVEVSDDAGETLAALVSALERAERLPRDQVRRHAEEHFDIETAVDRYIATYEELRSS